MKAITLHAPYASLIAMGDKTIETRSWPAPRKLVGARIAIHEGLTIDHDALNCCPVEEHPGCVVATARLAWVGQVESVEFGHSWPWDALLAKVRMNPGGILYKEWRTEVLVERWGDFTPGRWLWGIEDVEQLEEPVPAKGRQGFWEWDEGKWL